MKVLSKKVTLGLFGILTPFLATYADVNQGLVGYWPLNGDALDYSGNGLHGVPQSNVSFVSNPAGSGQVLQTAYGDTNGYVLVNIPLEYRSSNGESDFVSSGSLWVQFDDRVGRSGSPSLQPILGDTPGIKSLLRQTSSGSPVNRLRAVMLNGSGTAQENFLSDNDSLPSEGVWYHVAWTLITHPTGGSGHFRFYVNGNLVSSDNNTGVLPKATTTLKIGADNGGKSVNMKIMELRIYDRVLTTGEISELASGTENMPVEVIDGSFGVDGNIYTQGVVTVGDYESVVDELLNTQAGAIRFDGSSFLGFDGAGWLSLSAQGYPDKLTTPDGQIDAAVVDPTSNQLEVYHDTNFQGNVTLQVEQGDISMGVFTSPSP
ncbi:MAG: LamG domain-containing protein [Verrucomicrobiota bacterium]